MSSRARPRSWSSPSRPSRSATARTKAGRRRPGRRHPHRRHDRPRGPAARDDEAPGQPQLVAAQAPALAAEVRARPGRGARRGLGSERDIRELEGPPHRAARPRGGPSTAWETPAVRRVFQPTVRIGTPASATRSNASPRAARESRPVSGRQPAKQCTEHEPCLGRKRDIGRDADDDAKRQADHGSEPDGGSDLDVRECM